MDLDLDAAKALASDILQAHGVSSSNREVLAQLIVQAEFEGSRSHGLMRLPDYVSSIRSGWIDAAAKPVWDVLRGNLHSADCRRGFAQVATADAHEKLIATARREGMAALALRNSHHVGALWCDVEPLAHAGLIAITFVNSRCRLAPYGSTHRLLGTNAMAFSTPDGRGGALTWDQASSVMSLGDIKLYAAAGTPLPPGVGVNRDGAPTRDASAVLNGGAVLPFGGHKGSSIALMVEVMAAGMTGGNFGYEDESPYFPGAASSNAGQFLWVIDPASSGQRDFDRRMRALVDHLRGSGEIRLPGDRRAASRGVEGKRTISLSDLEMKVLRDCMKH